MMQAGDIVIAWGHGRFRPATVTKVGRTRIHVSIPMPAGYTYERSCSQDEVWKVPVNFSGSPGFAHYVNTRSLTRGQYGRRETVHYNKAIEVARDQWEAHSLDVVAGQIRSGEIES